VIESLRAVHDEIGAAALFGMPPCAWATAASQFPGRNSRCLAQKVPVHLKKFPVRLNKFPVSVSGDFY
jgi:hypothetical protein